MTTDQEWVNPFSIIGDMVRHCYGNLEGWNVVGTLHWSGSDIRTSKPAKVTRRVAPVTGVAYVDGAQTIIPTYVAESETPKSNGACHTREYVTDHEFVATGWYVEFHYPDQRAGVGQHRKFIPFTTDHKE